MRPLQTSSAINAQPALMANLGGVGCMPLIPIEESDERSGSHEFGKSVDSKLTRK